MMRRGPLPVVVLTLGIGAFVPACDAPNADPPRAEPAAQSAATSPPLAPKPPEDPLARLSVDELGAFLRDERIDLNAKDADAKLRAAVGKLPVTGRSVPLSCERNAKVQDVSAVVNAFGDAGASEVELKTPGRDGKIESLKVLPERRVPSLPDCAVVAFIKKDSTSAVWHKRGSTATKFRKGLAGPDLTMTVDGLVEQAKGCASPVWFLSGESGVSWGLVGDLGQRARASDPPLRPTEIGLPREAPIPGRPMNFAAGGSARP